MAHRSRIPFPQRPGLTPLRSRPSPASRLSSSLVTQAQSTLLAQQETIASLQASLASLSAAGQRPSGRTPAGATPEKCELEMSSAGFRTWRRSVEAWLSLSRWPDQEAVLHIRLLCVADLQRALDVKFTTGQWQAMPTKGALDAIGKIVLRASNQAVRWSDFFSVCQAIGEPVSAFFVRCAQRAMDCEFQCPQCECNLSEYMLLRKVMVGLGDSALKQEVFRQCHTFDDVESLRAFCVSFEAARRDATSMHGGKNSRECEMAGADVTPDDVSDDDFASRQLVVAASRHNSTYTHKSCRWCKSYRKREVGKAVNSVTVGAAGIAPEPLLQVQLAPQVGGQTCTTTAVADTGAQVCVAGPALIASLGLRPALLQRRAGLRDLAKIPLACLGAAPCHISLPGRSTLQEVHFVKSVERLYLSCTASPEPLILTPAPEYPFQQTVVDVFQLDGCSYLAYADRLTGWLEVAQLPSGATSNKIVRQLRLYFARWGAPEQISTDGGTNLVSEEMTAFFERWGVTVRLSSAHYPQSNGRAEAAVKSAKRVLRGNIGASGSLYSDKVALALLQYLNTPLRDIDKSPAQLATGRQLRDGVPAISQNFRVDEHWGCTLRERERQVARHNSVVKDHASGHFRSTITPGSGVLVQNQANKTWDRSGIVVEARDNRQYLIKLDGSGRLSLRTRKHLKPLLRPHSSPTVPPRSRVLPLSPQDHMPLQTPSGISLIHTPAPSRPRRCVARPGWLNDYVE
ncbi:hypothetical protein GWK47_015165 [Chionoecetes opilio]|uniref:Integrase catalytic domain-containing protein n=1 Tax=Chionoecetes opilio TaxID=41210 RepID=A0A8J5CIF7_CHIOP|nr:hypothetical protein GWK47_015165 [Chionoecetes opilio]